MAKSKGKIEVVNLKGEQEGNVVKIRIPIHLGIYNEYFLSGNHNLFDSKGNAVMDIPHHCYGYDGCGRLLMSDALPIVEH